MVVRTAEIPITTGYYFPDWFSVVLPEATTNLVLNPSVELNTTGYTAVGAGAAIARVLTDQRRGAYGLQVTPAVGVASGVYYGTITTVAGQPYAFSLDVHGVAGHTYNIYFASNAGAIIGAPFEFVATGYWQRVRVYYQEAAALARRFYIVQDASDIQAFYVDGFQVENLPYDTMYVDGDLEGFVIGEVAYGWNGIIHASTSYRAATTRSGGRVIKLKDYGLEIVGFTGLGLTPITNYSLPSNLGGAFYQSTIEETKTFTLIGDISAVNIGQLTAMRDLLETAFSYNLTPYRQPLMLHFQETDDCNNPIGESTFIKCLYQTGLEGVTDNLNSEKLALQFIVYDTHGIFAEGDRAIVAGFKDAMTAGGIVRYTREGLWETYARGAYDAINGGAVYDVLLASNGDLYAIGRFTNMGGSAGVAALNVARWSNGVWTALGAGLDGVGWCLTEGPDGRIYAGGAFHNAGGGATLHIAVWSGAAWAAVGAGLDDVIYDMEFAGNGDLIAVGSFHNVSGGGIAVAHIARWTPATATWAAFGAGLNNTGNEIKRSLGGNIFYVGGSFTTAGVVAANRICKLDFDLAGYFAALDVGFAAEVNSLAIDLNMNILAYGGGYLKRFNGSNWTSLNLPAGSSMGRNSISINQNTGDIISQTASMIQWNHPYKIKNSPFQLHGFDALFGHIKYLSDGSLVSFNSGYLSTYANGYHKNDLMGYIFKAKLIMACLANAVHTKAFRINSINQDAAFERTISTNEIVTIYFDPLSAYSNIFGNVSNSFYSGSCLKIPEYGNRDLSVL